MMRKLNLQKELFSQFCEAHPELGLIPGTISDPDKILESWKTGTAKKTISQSSLELIRKLKVNRMQYNSLIKKAPYNWVAKISGFQAI